LRSDLHRRWLMADNRCDGCFDIAASILYAESDAPDRMASTKRGRTDKSVPAPSAECLAEVGLRSLKLNAIVVSDQTGNLRILCSVGALFPDEAGRSVHYKQAMTAGAGNDEAIIQCTRDEVVDNIHRESIVLCGCTDLTARATNRW
jgi:hypothetical protein